MGKRKNRLLSKGHPNDSASCVVCGMIKVQKLLDNGKYESLYYLRKRKTCGKDTNCYRKFITGINNPNYKGYMPTCKECGKRISYNNAKDMKNGLIPQYCIKHWLPKMSADQKGIYPEWLKPYGYKKGENQLNTHKKNCQCFIHKSHSVLGQ